MCELGFEQEGMMKFLVCILWICGLRQRGKGKSSGHVTQSSGPESSVQVASITISDSLVFTLLHCKEYTPMMFSSAQPPPL